MGSGTTWVSVVFLMGIILIGLGLCVNQKFRAVWRYFFITHGIWSSIIFLSVAFGWQLVLIFNTHPAIGFDPGAIHVALTNPNAADLRSYFSYNSNNLPILLIQHQLAKLTHDNSWLFFDLVNLGLLCLTVIFNLITVRLIDRRKINTARYCHAVWLLLFPMVLVPYSDLGVLPLVSGLLLCYVILRRTQWSLTVKIIISSLAGVLATSIYFIKPSAIVPIIAILIIEILVLLSNLNLMIRQTGALIVITGMFLIAGFASYQLASQSVQKQTYIHIIKGRTLPPIHFISMGVSGDGGYNPKDALAMVEQPSQKAMVSYSTDKLIERLQQKGFLGYLVFLVHKQDRNTSDGTFTWLKEGHFMTETPVKTGGIKGIIQNIFYPGGRYLSDFHFIAQFFWVLCLGVITLGWRVRDRITDVLRLSIVGGLLYLLLFEGGRSRYIIQFLPLIIILTILVLPSVGGMLREKLAWLTADKKR